MADKNITFGLFVETELPRYLDFIQIQHQITTNPINILYHAQRVLKVRIKENFQFPVVKY